LAAFPAHRRRVQFGHGFAKPVHHEPSGLVGDAKLAMDFVSRCAVLALIEQVRGHPPLGQGNLGTLEHGPDRDGELTLAFVAIPQAGTTGKAAPPILDSSPRGHQGGVMLKQCIVAAAIVVAAVSNASAEFIDWRGSALITAASGCDSLGIGPGTVYNARYRHPNLGDNGAPARISMLANYHATSLSHPTGDFNNTFQTVKGVFVGGSGGTYNGSLRMTSRTPANITANTPIVTIKGIVRNFFKTSVTPNCQISFTMSVMR
jgi:hypothetical protein